MHNGDGRITAQDAFVLGVPQFVDAGLLLGMKAPGAEIIASVTFIAILMTILIQATTTPLVARKLGLLLEQEK